MLKFKLGRFKSKPDHRNLKMARYRTAISISLPDKVDYFSKVPYWGMMGNDSLGDCTCAAIGHMVEQATKYSSGLETRVSDSAVVKLYEEACGYNPSDPNSDQGGDMQNVLNYVRKTGISDVNGKMHKILAYISVNPMNWQEVQEAIYLFGNLYCGVGLPNTVQNEENPKSCWSVESNWQTDANGQAGSLGGHCIPLFGYSQKALNVSSWGDMYYMTPNFLRVYCDELYTVLTMDWLDAAGVSPSLFDLAQLQSDLQVVTA